MEEQEFHKSYAKKCFNECWNYIEKEDRSEVDNEEMRRLAETSFYHWSQVQDRTQDNVSVGYWQLARVYAISGRSRGAHYYANRCIKVSEHSELEPFYIGYAYEAKARAFALRDRVEQAQAALDKAYEFAEMISDKEWKDPLVADLDQIRNIFSN
jgi:hypothetical protein